MKLKNSKQMNSILILIFFSGYKGQEMIKREKKKDKNGKVVAGVSNEPDAYLWPRDSNGVVQIPYEFYKQSYYCKFIFNVLQFL